jgi:hypothetical protein
MPSVPSIPAFTYGPYPVPGDQSWRPWSYPPGAQGHKKKKVQWIIVLESNKIRVFAFLMALNESQEQALMGLEAHATIVKKMTEALEEIVVNITEYEEDATFMKNWQTGEDADHDQMQRTNARLTNRFKKFSKMRSKIGKKKGGLSISKEIVQQFVEWEQAKKIKTTHTKNKVTNPEDVQRVMKCGDWLMEHKLLAMFEDIEWSQDFGPTPLCHWGVARTFVGICEEDGAIGRYVLEVMHKIIFTEEEDEHSRLKKDKLLESSPKMQAGTG